MSTSRLNAAHPIDVLQERNILGQALLEATAALARGREPETILRKVCDALVASTSHIRLVWMKLGGLDADLLSPQYSVGPSKSFATRLEIDRSPGMSACPTRQAISTWEPVTGGIVVGSNGTPAIEAKELGLQSVMALPIGKQGAAESGVIGIYADHPDYFTAIGPELFTAFTDIVNASLEQAALLRSLSHLANHDQLTGVLNRRGLQDYLDRELSRSKRHDKPFGVILFDIDRFKLINDSLGHRLGDVALKGITRTVQDVLRKEDSLGRWGGEEFLCLIPETPPEQVAAVAERMRTRVADSPIETGRKPLRVTASFGYACYPTDGLDLDKLIAAADAALYQAKYSGRNRTVGARDLRQKVHSVGSMLDAALQEGRVVPAYQPIVELATGKVVAEEALARLITPEGQVLDAGQFVDAASHLQLIHRIDYTIMIQSFQRCVGGLTDGTNTLNHFVNISADTLRHRDLVENLLSTARQHCSACGSLIGEVKPMIIEITERELFSDIETARELLMPFIDFGLRLALDDFGSGYSSYQYLADLPISFLKLDGHLIQRIHEPKVRAIIQGIQDTADQLGIITLAEFVEDSATEAALKEIGVHWAQGFYYGKPRLGHDPTDVLNAMPLEIS